MVEAALRVVPEEPKVLRACEPTDSQGAVSAPSQTRPPTSRHNISLSHTSHQIHQIHHTHTPTHTHTSTINSQSHRSSDRQVSLTLMSKVACWVKSAYPREERTALAPCETKHKYTSA